MRSVGVICECNPYHAGHAHLLRAARAAGADCVVAVMSGAFVQRGEAAIADPHLRAEALLQGGADLVLELPFPYCAAPAESFAAAGVSILARLGVGELWFGSECGELSRLSALARLADSPEFLTAYEATARGNAGTAEAYFSCLCALAGEEVSCFSNDILALSYLRALSKSDAKMRPVTLKRQGSAYLDATLGGEFPSATALRRLWRERGLEAVLPQLPASVRDVYAAAENDPPSTARIERWILGCFRTLTAVEAESIAALSGGLGARMAQAARESRSLSELLERSATKKYTTSRMMRGILFALTEVCEADLGTEPAYTRLLAANEVGCAFLATARRSSTLPVVTRRSELPATPAAERQEELSRRAWSVYTLCSRDARGEDGLWRLSPVVFSNGKERKEQK